VARFDLHKFSSPEELAGKVAREFLRFVGGASGMIHVALSGGRIAGDFLSELAQAAKERGETLSSVHFFWSDERCVPPEDSQSNFRLAHERLLGPLEVPASRIHRIRGELAPPAAAKEAEGEMRHMVPLSSTGQPALNLVLLGMGEDGHVASLFPGEGDEVALSPDVYRPVASPKPPPFRITLGYAPLAAAFHVWVLASGPGKTTALEQSLAPEVHTPLGRMLSLRRQTLIFTDVA
jgi:6-phosphogluconolactonase